MLRHVTRISARHHDLLGSAGALTSFPVDSSRKALARILADTGAQVGQALSSISRAVAMSARLHEVDGLGSPRAEDVRERAAAN
ncbi:MULTISPECIES: hypothetical protein [unclassified Kitasatospora]|uniref:hypothetical protein n=1 Tax=unclassified Kitasatospora TaxID=2633591 RepID=UPI00070B8AA7|nr:MULTISPECIES: hypothetical protein [unclassified Kitasatospora]KQV20933.1 hypothetical protein ASC99_20735 [Kitasatospora sp. Root107]KRB60413.1 hypothetical protein ASE03_12445 [Kitasatospora sp. Root187]